MAAAKQSSPTVRHRTLSVELRRLREQAGFTRDEVAERVEDFSASKVMRYETGRWKRMQAREVRALLDLYGVTDQAQRDAYVAMSREARQGAWHRKYADILKGAYVGFEDEASVIQSFELAYIPGLFQTEAYARALLQAAPLVHTDQIERRLTLRMERKNLLDRDDLQGLWVIDEAAIRRMVGGADVMREQLRHLARITAEHPNIAVQVLPFAEGAHAGMDGAFVILSFPDPADKPVIYIETATDGLSPEGDEVLSRYTVMFNHLQMNALSLEESAGLLERIAAEL